MNWGYIFLAAVIYVIIVGCLCSSIRVVPYTRELSYTSILENFEDRSATTNFATSLGVEPQPVLCKKVHGFKDLQCCPNAKSQKIDEFGLTKGKAGCDGVGLFNSSGALCLNEHQLKLLTTRGGNMRSTDSKIGP
jgi:hypothetical protein